MSGSSASKPEPTWQPAPWPQVDFAAFGPIETTRLSLSYDHRVINGADAARFCIAFAGALADAEKLID